MKLTLLFSLFMLTLVVQSQNVFDPNDPIIRYDASKPKGDPQNPDLDKPGLQKFVSVPTNGISTGATAWDASTFKAYYFNYNGRKVAFRLKFPKSFTNPDSTSKKYPVMLFFHGAGEVGCGPNGGIYNNEKQLALGAKLFSEHVDNGNFDGFLIYPQLTTTDNSCWGSWGSVGAASYYNAMLKLIDSMYKYVRADLDRVFVNGLSAGGVAAFNMAKGYPNRIAGIAPSSAVGSTTGIPDFVHIPIWFATGEKDNNPSPAKASAYYNTIKNAGANIRWDMWKNVGHAAWTLHWNNADYVPFMNKVHKANPLVFFQQDEVCGDSTLNVKMGISAGYHSYEWKRGEQIIATKVGNTLTVLDNSVIVAFTGNEITVKQYGTYSVRFKRASNSEWSVWSPSPAVLKTKSVTQAVPIEVDGLRSYVLPAPDGSTTVPLKLPEGYVNYEWYRVNDNTLVSTERIFNAPVGTYKARYSEPEGCGSEFSPNFKVVDANGATKPAAPSNVKAVAQNGNVVLTWTDNANNETHFEIYRGTSDAGPFELISIVAKNKLTYTDVGVNPNQAYFYIIRAINNYGGTESTNKGIVNVTGDVSIPTAPSKLQYRGSTIQSIFLRWQPSTDPQGIKRYDIYLNGAKYKSTQSTTIELTGLDSLTLYAITVKAVDNDGNESPASNQVVAYTHHQGLNYKYYHGTYSQLPNYDALSPVKTGITDTITYGEEIRTQVNNYGLLYTGYIYIPETGNYTIHFRSDDGANLYIGTPYSYTAMPLIDNDGVHTSITKTTTTQLTQGYHPFAIAYFDRTGSERLSIEWESTDAGITREFIPKYFFSLNSATIPSPPAAPGNFTATALDFSRIRLNWQDLSNNETGFEIQRAQNASGPFVPVQTMAPGVTQFTDSGLNAATTYYYRIRTIGLGGGSAYLTANATTAPAPSVPLAPVNLHGFYDQNSAVLTWTDKSNNETGFRIYRSVGNQDNYALIATLPANTTAYSDPGIAPLTWYYYYVVAYNGGGNSQPTNVISVIGGNQPPVIGSIADILVKAGSSFNRDFTVTDPQNDPLNVELSGAPAYVSLTHLSGSNYRLTAAPGDNESGSMAFKVIASDNKGGISEKIVNLTIADKNTRAVLINFGHPQDPAPAPWNNWLGTRAVNSALNNLKDISNVNTAFSITSLHAWTSTNRLGHITDNNSGVFPDQVMKGGMTDSGNEHEFRIAGLNSSKKYNLVIFASRNEGLNAEMEISSGTQTVIHNARYNTTTTANLNGLVPAANGTITFKIKRINGSPASYLNALVIEEYDPGVAIINPSNLFAEVEQNGRDVRLTWSDRSDNEAATGGFILEISKDSAFLTGISVLNYNANVTSAVVTGLNPGERYWFRLRAKTASNVYSTYSNRAYADIAGSVMKVNFNYTVPNVEDSSWYNMYTIPTIPQTVGTITDVKNKNTGIEIEIVEPFNGEFNAGAATGNDSGIVPDNALQSAYWLDNTQISTIKLKGLNHTKKYRIGFFGSSSANGWTKGDYTAKYSVGSKSAYLNSWENNSKIVYINEVPPDADGNLLLIFSTTDVADYGFNSGIIIHELSGDSIYYNPQTGDTTSGNGDSLATEPPDGIRVYEVKVFPNPFRDALNIEFTKEEDGGHIQVDIHDVHGKLMFSRVYKDLPKGNNTISLFPGDKLFRKGLYFCTLKSKEKVLKTIRIMKTGQ